MVMTEASQAGKAAAVKAFFRDLVHEMEHASKLLGTTDPELILAQLGISGELLTRLRAVLTGEMVVSAVPQISAGEDSRETITGDRSHRLKTLRELAQLRPDEMAALGGISVATQYNYERGTRKPDFAYLQRLHDAGLDVLYLFAGHRTCSTLSSDEQQLLHVWHRASPAIQHAVMTVLLAATDKKDES